MTKSDLVTAITEKVGFTTKDSYQIVEQLFDIMKTTLSSGERVKVSGFGTWDVKEKNPRRGRNPQTGEELLLDGRTVLTFKASKVLKGRMGDG
ncbi:integration host factor subunit alpha [Thermodesulfobacteriota bacterium]